jgi:hypothetical protein
VQLAQLPEMPLPETPAPAPIVHSDMAPAFGAPISLHAAAAPQVELPSIVLDNSFATLLGTGFILASYEVNGLNFLASFDVGQRQTCRSAAKGMSLVIC